MRGWLVGIVAGLLLCAAIWGSQTRAQETVGRTMLTFHDQLRASRDALVFGDLESFRVYVAALAEPKPPLKAFSPPQRAHAQKIRKLARKARDVNDFGGATRVLGGLTAECGGCHQDSGHGPEFPSAPTPIEGDDSVTHMESYRWALERLWQGLTASDANAWTAGAAQLQDVEISLAQLPASARTPSVERIAAEMRKVGRRAGKAKARRERASLLAQVVDTCGRCHAASGVKGL